MILINLMNESMSVVHTKQNNHLTFTYGIQRKPIKTRTKTALSNPAYPMFL